MKILVACEESQRVCIELRKLGHEAYSCDIQEPSGGHPEWHILGDVLGVLNPSPETGGITFETMGGTYRGILRWDMIIAHPPCTYLTVSGNRWFNEKRYGESAKDRFRKRVEATAFFMEFAVNAYCDRIAIENPVGVMNSFYRKPDQIIEPYEYGHPVSKKTCLWLKGLPKLKPTKIVQPEKIKCNDGKYYSGAALHAKDETGKILPYNGPRTAKERSKTFPGIAKAMAEQWAGQA